MPKDLLKEAEIARGLTFAPNPEEVLLTSNYILAQVLFALWDSGFYEYVREHPRFSKAGAVEALGFDAMTFDWLMYYLTGRGLLRAIDGELTLTEKGQRFTNTITSGLLNLYVGGYNALLSNLGPLLRKEVGIHDPRLDRSAKHAAAGTEDLTCVRVVPQVIAILEEHEVQGVVDLGCGTGGFLIQRALLTGKWGAGVDMSEAALASAGANAAHAGVADKVSFYLGEVGKDPLPITDDVAARVGAVTAMFMLHEFGRGGDASIVRVLAALKAQFEGKLLVALEMPPVDLAFLDGRPPPSLDALDYHFIHPLSRQGEPRPKDVWQALYEQAGMKLVAVRRAKGSPVLIHIVRM
jgi:SAM-dependent methyltransferase